MLAVSYSGRTLDRLLALGLTSAHRCISSSSGESVGSWPPKRR